MSDDTRKKTVTLSGGRVATILDGKGRDLIRAGTKANDATNPWDFQIALLSELVEIDGAPVPYEEFLDEIEAHDIMALLGEALGGNSRSSGPAI
jgi:hypothetical protein